MDRLVLLGPPASGKGTQAARLSAHFGLATISTGQLLRAEERAGSAVGELSLELSKSGTLVPDGPVLALVEAALERHHDRFILDGFPRTIPQAQAFEALLERRGTPLDAVVLFNVPVSERARRARDRWTCEACGTGVPDHGLDAPGHCPACGGPLARRRDDHGQVFRLRLRQFDAKTRPLVDFYRQRGLLSKIDGVGGPDRVFQRTLRQLARPGSGHPQP